MKYSLHRSLDAHILASVLLSLRATATITIPVPPFISLTIVEMRRVPVVAAQGAPKLASLMNVLLSKVCGVMPVEFDALGGLDDKEKRRKKKRCTRHCEVEKSSSWPRNSTTRKSSASAPT